jgi:hypothetical protein
MLNLISSKNGNNGAIVVAVWVLGIGYSEASVVQALKRRGGDAV